MSRKEPQTGQEGRRKRPYRKPTVRSQRILQVTAVGGCLKVGAASPDCTFQGRLS